MIEIATLKNKKIIFLETIHVSKNIVDEVVSVI